MCILNTRDWQNQWGWRKEYNGYIKAASTMSSLSKLTCSTLSKTSSTARSLFRTRNTFKHKGAIAPNSRRTPSQLMKVLTERKKHDNLPNEAYCWCVEEARKRGTGKTNESVKSICERDSVSFNLYIPPSSIYTMLQEDRNNLLKSGPKTKIPRPAYVTLGYCIKSFIAISQVNGDPEVQNRHIITRLETMAIQKGIKISPRHFWDHIKAENPDGYSMAKEQIVELRRQQWTTKQNLNLWFDAWKKIFLKETPCFYYSQVLLSFCSGK